MHFSFSKQGSRLSSFPTSEQLTPHCFSLGEAKVFTCSTNTAKILSSNSLCCRRNSSQVHTGKVLLSLLLLQASFFFFFIKSHSAACQMDTDRLWITQLSKLGSKERRSAGRLDVLFLINTRLEMILLSGVFIFLKLGEKISSPICTVFNLIWRSRWRTPVPVQSVCKKKH